MSFVDSSCQILTQINVSLFNFSDSHFYVGIAVIGLIAWWIGSRK